MTNKIQLNGQFKKVASGRVLKAVGHLGKKQQFNETTAHIFYTDNNIKLAVFP